ncbi:MAG: hypothetical protein IPM34_03100 [Saprospiraceae bacterium]|nr:hypothetical protein [Saprospiraceae bacterium]
MKILPKLPILALVLLISFQNDAFAQATGFGLKAGPSMGFQKWGGGNQLDPLWRWHVAAFLDSESSDGKNILYGHLGYHVKGAAIRFNAIYDINGNRYPGASFAMEFHNLSFELGMKRFLKMKRWKPFYAVGLRGEYTLSTKFEVYPELQEWTKKWNYGVSLRLGTEYAAKKLVHYGLELNIAPDLSKQVYVPAAIRRIDPWTGQVIPGYEQSTVNTTIELSFYVRFKRIIIYEDE